MIFANNTILECGDIDGSTVCPSILIGEAAGFMRIMVANNTVRRAYGPGIVTQGAQGCSDLIVRGNVIDEFGIDARGKSGAEGCCGINTSNYVRTVVADNIVRAGEGINDRCDIGIGTGGSNGNDCWTSGNITIGKFAARSIVGTLLTGPPVAPLDGERVRIGHNVDITTGQPSPGYDVNDNPYIPILTAEDSGPSVAGSNIWRLYQPRSFTVSDFTDGYMGQSITILFYDNNTVMSESGNLRLVGGGFNSTVQSTLTLIFGGSHWIETGRSATT